jgi:hypothetical protein
MAATKLSDVLMLTSKIYFSFHFSAFRILIQKSTWLLVPVLFATKSPLLYVNCRLCDGTKGCRRPTQRDIRSLHDFAESLSMNWMAATALILYLAFPVPVTHLIRDVTMWLGPYHGEIYFMPPAVTVEWMALLLHVREHLFLDTECSDWGYRVFSHSPQTVMLLSRFALFQERQCPDSDYRVFFSVSPTSYATIASFRIYSKSLFITFSLIWRSAILQLRELVLMHIELYRTSN